MTLKLGLICLKKCQENFIFKVLIKYSLLKFKDALSNHNRLRVRISNKTAKPQDERECFKSSICNPRKEEKESTS